MPKGAPSYWRSLSHEELEAEVYRLEGENARLYDALRMIRTYAAQIEQNAGTSLQSLRASLIQEIADRALGDYPPSEDRPKEENRERTNPEADRRSGADSTWTAGDAL